VTLTLEVGTYKWHATHRLMTLEVGIYKWYATHHLVKMQVSMKFHEIIFIRLEVVVWTTKRHI